jgi:hypothetical protein
VKHVFASTAPNADVPVIVFPSINISDVAMIHRLILDSIEEDLLAVPQNLNDICIFTDDAELDTGPRTDINYGLNWFSPGSNGDEAKKQEAESERAFSFHVRNPDEETVFVEKWLRTFAPIRT